MAFENFPYGDLHTLNIDWVLRKLKELEAGTGTSNEDLLELINRGIRNTAMCLNGGPGLLRMIPTNVSGMSMGGDLVYRTKVDSTLHVGLSFTNNTASAIPSNTALVSFENFPSDFTAITLRGVTATLYLTDGTTYVTTPVIHWDSGLQKITIFQDLAVPVGAKLVVNGSAPCSVGKDFILARGMWNAALANDICNVYLHGTTGDPWSSGQFEYNNNDAYRLDPQYRKTDCSGMVYIAYQANGFKPSRGATAKPYWSDGMVISYADAGQALDLSRAKAGDVICYQDKTDPNSIPHCTLYMGDNTVGDMSNNYPTTENQAGCLDGRGPYHITSTPAATYRNYSFNRFVVRFL